MIRKTILVTISLATPLVAQDHSQMNHSAHTMQQGVMQQVGSLMPEPMITEAGQAAFASIQEIVDVLQSDPQTDWSVVNIDALREHLVDMNNVTMFAEVKAIEIDGGARFEVTSDNPSVVGSIQSMSEAHSAMVTSDNGWMTEVQLVNNGAIMSVSSSVGDAAKIRGLGFFGILSLGMHHQDHHFAIAQGANPHSH